MYDINLLYYPGRRNFCGLITFETHGPSASDREESDVRLERRLAYG
ncbi:MAG: hypothetical protein IIA87_02960 [Nanoarchaeota archaeon]|nr:hypothetical protein [Nanoarchaeota archaeon]